MATTSDIFRARRRGCQPRENSYIGPQSGFLVTTAHDLQSRRYCGGAGCRYGPYPRPKQAAAGRLATAPSRELNPPH